MKILDIILSLDPTAGGPQHTIRSMEPVWRAMGHQADCVTFDSPDAPFIEPGMPSYAIGGRHAPRPSRGMPRLLRHYGYHPGALRKLAQIVPHYDVALVHSLWNFSTFAARRVLAGGKVPYFVLLHGNLDPWHKTAYPLKDKVKQMLWPLNEGWLLRHAAGVMFTTQAEIDLARGTYRPYRLNPLLVGYGCSGPGDDAAAQIDAFHAAFPQLRSRKYLLFLSRIHPKKGCDTLLRAYAQTRAALGAVDLVFAGPDQIGWQQELVALAGQLGIADRVHWTGMISGAVKWGAYRAAEAFVLPSHGENFGVVVAEAMACGTPVVISDRVNLYPAVLDYGAGLVAPHDLAGTIGVLQAFAALTPDQRAQMAQNALRCYHANYELETAARAMIDAITRQIGGASKA